MNPNLQERKMKKKPISEAALNALKGEVLEGNLFQLKAGWVKAAVFRELRIIFETMIGTWSKEEKGFKFTACPKRMIEEMIASGGYIHPPRLRLFPHPGDAGRIPRREGQAAMADDGVGALGGPGRDRQSHRQGTVRVTGQRAGRWHMRYSVHE